MQVLFVDDEPLGREIIADHLENHLGHDVTQCDSGEKALKLFGQIHHRLVMTDIRMPGIDGIELLKRIKKSPEGRTTDIVLITAHGDMSTAIAALRAGAYDYLNKPIELDELDAVVNRVVEHQALIKENYELTHFFNEKVEEATRETNTLLEQLRSSYAEITGIGEVGVFSDSFRRIIDMLGRLREDRNMPVLIEGETGTGKEIIARLIHLSDDKHRGPFVAINCSTIPANLVESELFGYEGGAFTGAKKAGQSGKFELARNGTVFLDEISDMPLEIQPKLLRVMQERDYYRVGGLRKIKLEAQVICASNNNLKTLVEEGKFREDLYYRLNVGRVLIPPLRERREEIKPLALMFMERFAARRNRNFKTISPEVIEILENYSWPGNIRELQNVLERLVLLYDDIEVKPAHLEFLISMDNHRPYSSEAFGAANSKDSLLIKFPEEKLSLEDIESEVIRKVLDKFNGNRSKAADYLGITRQTLRKKII